MARRSVGSLRKRRDRRQSRPQKERRLYYWLAGGSAVLIVAVFALFYFLNPPGVTVPDSLSNPASSDGAAWGPANAPVLVEVFSDFQCPFCAQFAVQAGQPLEEEYADTGLVRFEYKHFAFLGAESILAAEASECAAEQGQFWAYHDTLFANQRGQNQGAYSRDALKEMAAALGLDTAAFNSCLDSGRYRSLVQQQTAEAQRRGVTSTPTTYVNGQSVSGAVSYDELRGIVTAALNRQP